MVHVCIVALTQGNKTIINVQETFVAPIRYKSKMELVINVIPIPAKKMIEAALLCNVRMKRYCFRMEHASLVVLIVENKKIIHVQQTFVVLHQYK